MQTSSTAQAPAAQRQGVAEPAEYPLLDTLLRAWAEVKVSQCDASTRILSPSKYLRVSSANLCALRSGAMKAPYLRTRATSPRKQDDIYLLLDRGVRLYAYVDESGEG